MTAINYYAAGSCSSPSNSLGNLTYSYDNDSRIMGVGGSLAAVNVPAAVSSATYGNTNQVATWKGVNASKDDANNLVGGASTGRGV